MSRCQHILIFSTILLFCLFSPAQAGLTMPEEIESEFTQYPGSQVVNTTSTNFMKQVVLDCGSDALDRVYDYYKDKAAGNGWIVMMENKTPDLYTCLMKKEDKSGNIAVAGENGKTSATLAIMHRTSQ